MCMTHILLQHNTVSNFIPCQIHLSVFVSVSVSSSITVSNFMIHLSVSVSVSVSSSLNSQIHVFSKTKGASARLKADSKSPGCALSYWLGTHKLWPLDPILHFSTQFGWTPILFFIKWFEQERRWGKIKTWTPVESSSKDKIPSSGGGVKFYSDVILTEIKTVQITCPDVVKMTLLKPY